MKTPATKRQTEAEIRDDLEWSLNEYTKAMALHKIKASQSFVDVFVITPLEILENVVKFNWSKIAKGALQLRKRKVDLMELKSKRRAGNARMFSMPGSGLAVELSSTRWIGVTSESGVCRHRA